MIPEEPKEFDERSHEDVVFNALKNNYHGDEEYYVFHSYHAVAYSGANNTMYDRDIDFVIANAKKGLICIEVKAGSHIYFTPDDRKWHYGNGDIMEHDGPYNQIYGATRTLRNKVEFHRSARVSTLLNKCRFIPAVCFVDLPRSRFLSSQGLPEEASIQYTILFDDLENIWDKVEHIYSINIPTQRFNSNQSEGMNSNEFKLLLDSVLCPEFHLIPSPEATNGIINFRLKQLVREQYIILDFLEEQSSAVINGAAGTGKTMIATEKARLHSKDSEKVLFLCYNKKLQKKLEDDNKNNSDFQNVDFMTISKLTKDKTGSFDNYAGLENWLDKCIRRETDLGYKHIIIDEGQDFGVIDINRHPENEDEGFQNCEIINKLHDAAMEQGGTFYLFYDKYQTIQGGQKVENILPDCIDEADCRLTLHKNCRNTKEIARTSVTPIKDKKGRSLKVDAAYSWVKPYVPVIHVIDSKEKEISILNQVLDNNKSVGISDIVILTQGSINSSSLANKLIPSTIEDPYDYYQYNGKKYRVATCITFKGLEADAIILMNLDGNSFAGDRAKEFYVGTSRAKCKLDMICTLADDDYFTVVSQIDEGALNGPRNKNAMRHIFGNLFSADVKVNE